MGSRVQPDGFGGRVLMHHLLAALGQTPVRVESNTQAYRLVLDGNQVVGVVATSFGADRFIRARRAVILTTGGFIDNPDKVEQQDGTFGRVAGRTSVGS